MIVNYKDITWTNDANGNAVEIAGVENAVETTDTQDQNFTLAQGESMTITQDNAIFYRVSADKAIRVETSGIEYCRDYVAIDSAVFGGGITTINVLKTALQAGGYILDPEKLAITLGTEIKLSDGTTETEIALALNGAWIEAGAKLQLVVAGDSSANTLIKIQETNTKVFNSTKFILTESAVSSIKVTGLNTEETEGRILIG
jgi:hypothetical protein